MTEKWYYVKDGVKYGPFDKVELSKIIERDTIVWTKGMSDWVKASELREFDYFFSSTPPPIPDQSIPTKESTIKESPKVLSKITDSVFYGWSLILLTIFAGILEYSENDDGLLYRITIYLCLSTSIRIYIGLKSYLSNLLNFKEANININWIIGISIPFYLLIALDQNNFQNEIPEKLLITITILVLFASFLYVYHNLKLAVKLFKVEDSSINSFKIYAFLQIISFGFILGILFYNEDDEFPLILSTVIELVPLLFLVTGLQKVRDKYIPKSDL